MEGFLIFREGIEWRKRDGAEPGPEKLSAESYRRNSLRLHKQKVHPCGGFFGLFQHPHSSTYQYHQCTLSVKLNIRSLNQST
ncbi:MAG: hypothetical protein UW88_C0011G0078 [Candidatus Collierbacteria bacterium GW2011_GWD2_45_10]|uniref:Uncharacterized protein n=1 Tax=Candidatus Collierbacteria bacterium GW2011_GWB2_44_22 TaxID=1618387 RepID=A0A0G1HXH5_9BACT|nr:MAG: hypothetical protein UW31_C0006G0037 [Candidatus Collierbacteria bacterium GW2011_GWA2_44_13]KKT51318.1 MAG: hypothetical protein UW44_C0013G0038 [Candidatus Collierbacteria bacterium GW2011_GWB2_44_22]KKT66558.1 MAG: hypothetical protein UW58_C0006G0021 [Candidatus Collierbacteria bacterium GW2011_GWC2_44_30]KKT88438.1 MAG: hypothetical protein UW88_C0011G0078 [Candidatus Collierbacteria bacterium GW2011_GWD2_45_10]